MDRRIVIVGAGGRLGAALVREYARDFEVVGFNHAQLDLGAPEQLRSTLEGLNFGERPFYQHWRANAQPHRPARPHDRLG